MSPTKSTPNDPSATARIARWLIPLSFALVVWTFVAPLFSLVPWLPELALCFFALTLFVIVVRAAQGHPPPLPTWPFRL